MSNKKLLFFALIAALASFLFGYTTVVISGALLLLEKEFQLFHFHSELLVGILLIGAVIGAVFAGKAADRWGRKPLLVCIGLGFILGALPSVYATSFSTLLLGRAISGFIVGLASVVAPLYLSEIAPLNLRGRFTSFHQLAIALGGLFGYLVNYLWAFEGGWRAMFGLQVLPAALLALGAFFISETPSFYASKTGGGVPKKSSSLFTLFAPERRRGVIIGISLSAFQQVTGISAVIYFSAKIFQNAGFTTPSEATFASLGIGLVSFLATFASLFLIDRLGRKPLLFYGTLGMVLSLLLVTLALSFNITANTISLYGLMSYVAFFSIGLGPITWVMLPEMYPSLLRAEAVSIATLTNWVCNSLISLSFLFLVAWMGMSGAFLTYAFFGILTLFFIRRFLPETKGKTSDEIWQSFSKYTDLS